MLNRCTGNHGRVLLLVQLTLLIVDFSKSNTLPMGFCLTKTSDSTHHASNKIVSVDSMLLQQLSIIFCHTGVISNKIKRFGELTDNEIGNL